MDCPFFWHMHDFGLYLYDHEFSNTACYMYYAVRNYYGIQHIYAGQAVSVRYRKENLSEGIAGRDETARKNKK